MVDGMKPLKVRITVQALKVVPRSISLPYLSTYRAENTGDGFFWVLKGHNFPPPHPTAKILLYLGLAQLDLSDKSWQRIRKPVIATSALSIVSWDIEGRWNSSQLDRPANPTCEHCSFISLFQVF